MRVVTADLYPAMNDPKDRGRDALGRCVILLSVFVGIYKNIRSDVGLSYGAAKGSDGKDFVDRDYATFILFAKDNMAAALSDYSKAKRLENLDGFGPGDSWQLRH